MKSFFTKVRLWFVNMYANAWYRLCVYLLNHMKLNEVEKMYVAVSGQKITDLHYFHDSQTVYGGCSEARMARREANYLEMVSKEKLTSANVSEERQMFLSMLLTGAHKGYLESFPSRQVQQLWYHFNQLRRKKIFKQVGSEFYKLTRSKQC